MGKTIHLLQYNNYFNRTIKGQDLTNLPIYLDNGATLVSTIKNMNLWNPNDGVDTTITSKIDMYAIPDYCLVCDENSDIVLSRWFVIEATRVQGGQYRLRLHRDVIADNYNEIIENNDTYVERGWCDVSNSAIYNKEPITFNEIKNKQTELYDVSLCPWIVMYFTPNKTIDGKESAFPDDMSIEIPDPDNSAYLINPQYTYEAYGKTDPVGGWTIKQLPDAPYAMMAIPYATRTYYNGDTLLGTITRNQALAIAQGTSRRYSSGGWLMDMQIVPYCPCREVLRSDGNIDISKAVTSARVYIGVKGERPNPSGAVICCSASSFVTSCYTAKGELVSLTINDIKIETLTAKNRLVSPNGNGVFEFDPAKMVYSNGATVKFDAYCTYMPYQPYIKVVPRFGRLYGTQYLDYRGLVCGGDFSLPQISDSWEAYQIQNKNYQAMFNRQIESLDLQNKWSTATDITGAITGTISAGAAGSLIAGGVGAAVGGVTSAAGGVLDVYANNQLRVDNREATIQQHNWQLQNIQALPYSITKVNNFNQDNTYVPYLEYYSCDDYEVDNLIKYLDKQSYNISRYGKFSDYKKPTGKTFLQGTIIKLESVKDDSHYLATIADEVHQGFYVGQEVTDA